jgi:hypothetical protein
MNWGFIGLLVVLALFVILLVVNPKLSCFGKRIASPLYPVFRGRKRKRAALAQPAVPPQQGPAGKGPEKPVEDYGFKLH